MVEAILDVGTRTFGMSPGGSGDLAPPGCGGDRVFDEFIEAIGWKMNPEDERPLKDLGLSTVVGVGDKSGEVSIGDGIGIDVEGRECDGADGSFTVSSEGVGVVGAHEKGAARE